MNKILLAALRKIDANAAESPDWIRNVARRALDEAQQPPEQLVFANPMTLRDYFAAKAMQGDIQTYIGEDVCGLTPSISDETLLQFSKVYYRMADAMLLAREVK